MPERENLYFIAIIPQKEVYDAITRFKNDFATRFNSERALRVMPHITLKAPFTLPASEHSTLINWFKNLSVDQSSFEIELKDFGSFANKNNPVVYVDPIMNRELATLQKDIIKSFKNLFPDLIHSTDLKFKPHMTIAYRDLSFEKYQEAWKEYNNKEYQALFEVESFYLLQHDTRQWNIIATYSLIL